LNQTPILSDQPLLSTSPSTSPTHSGGGVSRLATHAHKSKTSPTGASARERGADDGSMRRSSDSEIQRHGVKVRGAIPSHVRTSHSHSRSIDETLK
jgi:hypothetical protein